MSIYGEEYGQTIIPGELGSTALTQSQDNSGNTGSLGNANTGNGAFLGEGVRSGIDSWDKAYTDAGGKIPSRFGLSDLKQFALDNKSWLAGAGALASVYGGGSNVDKKTGYQGVIPTLAASRSMIAAPPTRAQGYRPGAGGIDYGGDVSYKLAPGMDPYANLSGTSGSLAGANLTSDVNSVAATTAAAAKTAADLAAAKKAGDAAAIAAAQKAADAAAAAKVAADKAAADKAAADKTVTTKTTNLGSAGYQAAIKSGLTPAQYYGNINQWLIDNPRASRSEIDAIMAQVGVSKEDLQKALGTSGFSDFTKYGLTQGQGLQELNFAIADWVAKNPFATAQEIKDIMKASGATQEDIGRGLNALSASAGKEAAVVGGMGLDQLYKNILDYQSKPRTPEEIAAALAATGLEQRDLNAAQRYATEKGYVGNPKSEAANFDYLANTKAADTTAANTSVADTLAAVESSAGTPVIQQPVVQEAVVQTPVVQEAVVQQPTTASDNTNDIYRYFADPSTQAMLAAGDVQSIAETMQALGWSPAEVAAATNSNPAEVQAAYDAALGIGNADYGYMQAAEGGYLGYADGGEIAMAKGRYLQGQTDGMADELPARIGKDQPAALSHGEFVIPADVVSHMGNGNSDAGAKKLYQMMDKIRMARTGNKKQGKKINPDKFMPGGLAQAYASGGEIKKFETGGLTTANKNASMGISGVESNLSNWAGPYVTNMLGQGQALANMPYQAYMGQLTAGESPLQTGAFGTAGSLTTPTSIGNAATTAGGIATKAADLTYKPTTSAFDATQAQTYMNPYLESSLKPQLEEARRQSQLTQTQNAAKMTQAGAFGGGRQAILDAETQRNLANTQANITGQGYSTAYDKAMAQFNADQARKAQENQFGATYGLQGLQTGLQAAQAQGGLGATQASTGLANLNAQLSAGAQQRGIESEGIAADKAQFEEARANPYKMVQYQQSLLQGLPLAAQSYQGIDPSTLTKAAQGATSVNQLLKNLGLIS